MWKLFKRRRDRMLSFEEYSRQRERLWRLDPQRFEDEQRQAQEWTQRLVELRRKAFQEQNRKEVS